MSTDFPFEQSLKNLEEIVKQLEQGELTLDESLKKYEQAISLARNCQEVLSQAEQKIELLNAANPRDEQK
jgi:exodeoxyribonuclease VII small subunit